MKESSMGRPYGGYRKGLVGGVSQTRVEPPDAPHFCLTPATSVDDMGAFKPHTRVQCPFGFRPMVWLLRVNCHKNGPKHPNLKLNPDGGLHQQADLAYSCDVTSWAGAEGAAFPGRKFSQVSASSGDADFDYYYEFPLGRHGPGLPEIEREILLTKENPGEE